MIEGVYHAGDHCLIIEDIITTGSSILETASELEKAGLVIQDVIALICREKAGYDNLAKHFQPHVCFTMQTMLEVILQSNLLSPVECDIVEKYLGEHCE